MPRLVAKLANAKLLIVGDGPIKRLVELCKNLNLEDSVIFTGEQPWESIGLFIN